MTNAQHTPANEQEMRDREVSALEEATNLVREGKANALDAMDMVRDLVRAQQPAQAHRGTAIGDAVARTRARIAERKANAHWVVPTQFEALNNILGGGFEPGVHVLVGGTGVGKSTFAIACAIEAATKGHPVGYVSLELELEQITARMLAEIHNRKASAPAEYGTADHGKAHRAFFSNVMRGDEIRGFDFDSCAGELEALPIVIDARSPLGWPATNLAAVAEQVRHGNDKTPLVVLDYLQLVGADEDMQRADVRARISQAASIAHGIATKMRAAVLLISSVARSYYALLAGKQKAFAEHGVRLMHDASDSKGASVNGRRLFGDEGLVGLGKESGEIEYSATSVLAMINGGSIYVGPNKTDFRGKRVALAVAKSRMGWVGWTPLRFSFGMLEDGDDVDAKCIAKRTTLGDNDQLRFDAGTYVDPKDDDDDGSKSKPEPKPKKNAFS